MGDHVESTASLRVLVFGSRTYGLVYAKDMSVKEYRDPDGLMGAHLDLLWSVSPGGLTVISGKAPGADTLAERWATAPRRYGFGVTFQGFPADWDQYGKAAGPIRNQQMLKEGDPDIALGFVDKPLAKSKGSADMAARIKNAHKIIPLYITEKIR